MIIAQTKLFIVFKSIGVRFVLKQHQFGKIIDAIHALKTLNIALKKVSAYNLVIKNYPHLLIVQMELSIIT